MARIPITLTNLTEDTFKKWHTSNLAMANLSPTPVSTNPATKSSTQIELDNFKKGIKRDLSLYPVLTQDSQWDSWNRTVVALARAQAVSDVFDPNFTPVLLEEITLFNEKQKYMYSVFEQCLQSDKGRSIIRTHEDTFDAQKVYKAMFDYSNLSTKAHLESTALFTYISAACLGDGTWKGSTCKFILHWEEQVRQYEKLIDKNEHFPPTVKLHMLQNAVHNIAVLWQIKVQADQLATHSGKKMDYDEYIPLLSSAAAQYDSQFTSNNGSKAATCHQNFAHEFLDQYKEYDIDTPSTTILANRTSFDAMMPGHVWSQLAPEDKAVWDKLSDNTKQLILNARARGDQQKPPSAPNFRPNPKFKPKHKVNIHDFIQVFQHLTSDENDDEDDVPDESPDAETEEQEAPEPDDTIDLLSYAANRQNNEVPPAHLAKMLSNTIARYEKRGATKANKATQKKVTYMANACFIKPDNSYNVSRNERVTASKGTLIDGGSNGGLAGREMRVISVYDNHRTVSIEGIGQHRINDVKLGSAGAVVNTQSGPVIAIVHNYAFLPVGKTIHSVGQIEAYSHRVFDKSIKVGGLQSIETFDGYVLPLNIRRGLPYLSMRPFTDEEFDTLPHVVLTSEAEWIPSVLDHKLEADDKWMDKLDYPFKGIFNLRGDYAKREVMSSDTTQQHFISVHKAYQVQHCGIIEHNEPDYKSKFWLAF